MRALFAFPFLLCLVMAFQGIASTHVLQQPCPIDHSEDTVMIDGLTMVDPVDCCNDAATAAKTGKLCKSDLPCSSSCAQVLPSLQVGLTAAKTVGGVPMKQTLLPSPAPSSVWRPPTLS